MKITLLQFIAAMAVWLLLTTTESVYGQSPAFEVASIRLNTDPPPHMGVGPGLRHGTLNALYVTLRHMLAAAYGVTEPRVIGPGWLDGNHFDVAGKAPAGVPDSQLKPMLQALLKDRFKLVAHLETSKMPVYYLVIAKGGVKMPVYPAPDRGPEHPWENTEMRGFPMERGTGTASAIAGIMSGIVGRPVIDKTGLSKRYSYFFSYAPLSLQADDKVPELGPPDLFTAIQKRLGLKLEPAKDNVEVVIVDHAERLPTDN